MSSRIASLMEKVCTLLQYKVHLSIFHSSPTSKIWYTSTYHDVHWDGGKHQVCIVQKICPKGSQTLLSLTGARENFFFSTSNVIISQSCKTFCTCSPSSLGQDPTAESAKKINKKLIWAT
jgi:hypothetical protein